MQQVKWSHHIISKNEYNIQVIYVLYCRRVKRKTVRQKCSWYSNKRWKILSKVSTCLCLQHNNRQIINYLLVKTFMINYEVSHLTPCLPVLLCAGHFVPQRSTVGSGICRVCQPLSHLFTQEGTPLHSLCYVPFFLPAFHFSEEVLYHAVRINIKHHRTSIGMLIIQMTRSWDPLSCTVGIPVLVRHLHIDPPCLVKLVNEDLLKIYELLNLKFYWMIPVLLTRCIFKKVWDTYSLNNCNRLIRITCFICWVSKFLLEC